MSNTTDKDAGVIAAALRRLEIDHLPRIQSLHAKADKGETLNEIDLNFIGRVYDEINHLGSVIDRNRDYLSLATKVIDLCDEVTKKAIANEKK